MSKGNNYLRMGKGKCEEGKDNRKIINVSQFYTSCAWMMKIYEQ